MKIYRVLEVLFVIVAVIGLVGAAFVNADADGWIKVLLICASMFIGGMLGAAAFEHLYFKSIKRRRSRRV